MAPTRLGRIAAHPLIRCLIGIGLFVVAGATAAGVSHLLRRSGVPRPIAVPVTGLLAMALELAAYLLLVTRIERRRPTELAPRRLLPDFCSGALAGLLLISAVIGTIAALGGYRVVGVGSPAVLPAWLGLSLLAAVGEELLFRGVLFRLVEAAGGSAVALAVSAALFGGAHLLNPGATLWSATAIALEAGVLLGAAFMATRSLWFTIGLHAAWNAAEGGLYGSGVSGVAMPGLLTPRFSGGIWLTGGRFGIEASVPAVVLGLLLAVWFLWRARKATPGERIVL